jgi:tryptophan synthase alpha chain
VTGDGQAPPLAPVQARLQALRRHTDRPLAVGFGLDHPDLLAQVRAMGATPVIGSALVQALHDGRTVAEFIGPRLG